MGGPDKEEQTAGGLGTGPHSVPTLSTQNWPCVAKGEVERDLRNYRIWT